jgi:hypothetical protein
MDLLRSLAQKLSHQNHGNEMHGLESLRKGGKRTQVPQPGGISPSRTDCIHLKELCCFSYNLTFSVY